MTFATVVEILHDYEEQLAQLQAVLGRGEMVQQAKRLQYFFEQTLWSQVTQLEVLQPHWQSATTEIHRHMRLLSIEVSFFESARQSQTHKQRLAQVERRLKQLKGFTQVLIALCEQ